MFLWGQSGADSAGGRSAGVPTNVRGSRSHFISLAVEPSTTYANVQLFSSALKWSSYQMKVMWWSKSLRSTWMTQPYSNMEENCGTHLNNHEDMPRILHDLYVLWVTFDQTSVCLFAVIPAEWWETACALRDKTQRSKFASLTRP